ncbi:solute carrier family 52, riboflavin transporter, member 3-A-like isoform X1 [Centruroides vittatus]|uniref:solute carrier family 52, riboflavin transporter, member 3-A-like isoform X1 n=1 Tax=Centruroides vittatus TaxID=120091 RepID=UPI003510059F
MGKRFLSYDLNRSYLIDTLSLFYGIGSWIAMTGLWVELPVLTPKLPEGWSLASRLALVLQFANVSCIIYGIGKRYWPRYFNEVTGTHAQMLIGALSCILLIPFWHMTVYNHSISLFILSFGLAIVDCASSIVFVPYMARFPSIYMTPYLIGEGISGFLPSIVALIQDVEELKCINVTSVRNNQTIIEPKLFIEEPRFPPEVFFAILLAMVMLSWISFCLLNYLPVCKNKMILSKTELKTCDDFKENFELEEAEELSQKVNTTKYEECSISKSLYIYLLSLETLASLTTFGIFPAIQPYSCLPYGTQEYHLSVTLSGLAYPLSCLLALFVETKSITKISILSAISTVISIYLLMTAIMSPSPPLVNTNSGSIIIVCSWVLFIGIFSYVKTMIALLMRNRGNNALFWYGAVTQIGAAVGAVLMFLLVNVANVFQDEENCAI